MPFVLGIAVVFFFVPKIVFAAALKKNPFFQKKHLPKQSLLANYSLARGAQPQSIMAR
jgi:hypothetical protein